MLLIDVSDVSTIPAEIKQKIEDRLMSLHSSSVSKIKGYNIRYDHDVTCAIDDYLGPRLSYDQDSIIFQFVAYFAGKYFWNYDYGIHFDGNTDKAIPAGDIIELIPYTVNRYYFNKSN